MKPALLPGEQPVEPTAAAAVSEAERTDLASAILQLHAGERIVIDVALIAAY